jgi:hypothetical protein
MSSFIVQFWKVIFRTLGWFSVFHIIRLIFPKETKNRGFIDSWVLLNFILSLTAIFVVRYMTCIYLTWVLIVWGALRTLEIVVYQTNILFFNPFENDKGFDNYILGGYRRIIFLSIHNYLEIIFWFSSLYLYANSFSFFDDPNGVLNSCLGTIYYSVVTMTTLGCGDVTPCNDWTRFLVFLQTLIGIFMLAIIITRFISFLPRPKTIDDKEQTKDSS